MGPGDVMLVLTTAPDDDRADQWARTIVEERLAACVNVHGSMRSVYRWKGAVEQEAERQLVIKTTRRRVAALRARLRELHSYELPELMVLAVEEASEEYAGWIRESTSDQTRSAPATPAPGPAPDPA